MHRCNIYEVHVILITWHGAKALIKSVEKQLGVVFCHCCIHL